MRRRQPALPTLWLMTDERQGDGLWRALEKLPRGAGIVFRHHATPAGRRRALFDRVRRIARARRLVLVLAGPPRLAVGWKADGAHGRSPHRHAARRLIRTAPAHDRMEIVAARRSGADLALLSPLFATRSHPGARALGRVRFLLIARDSRVRIAALGGVARKSGRFLIGKGCAGWAAIDGLA